MHTFIYVCTCYCQGLLLGQYSIFMYEYNTNKLRKSTTHCLAHRLIHQDQPRGRVQHPVTCFWAVCIQKLACMVSIALLLQIALRLTCSFCCSSCTVCGVDVGGGLSHVGGSTHPRPCQPLAMCQVLAAWCVPPPRHRGQ